MYIETLNKMLAFKENVVFRLKVNKLSVITLSLSTYVNDRVVLVAFKACPLRTKAKMCPIFEPILKIIAPELCLANHFTYLHVNSIHFRLWCPFYNLCNCGKY